jgi:hypothetical protein
MRLKSLGRRLGKTRRTVWVRVVAITVSAENAQRRENKFKKVYLCSLQQVCGERVFSRAQE